MIAEVKRSDWKETILQLVAASTQSNYLVIALLTDLRETWPFYWLKDNLAIKILTWKDINPHALSFGYILNRVV